MRMCVCAYSSVYIYIHTVQIPFVVSSPSSQRAHTSCAAAVVVVEKKEKKGTHTLTHVLRVKVQIPFFSFLFSDFITISIKSLSM